MNSPARIDLHVHSTCSDGTCAPELLPELALKAGLSAVALTDHDTVAGIPAFLAAAKQCGITAVPGIEISTRLFSKELHIVGLFIRPDAPKWSAFMDRMQKGREVRNRAIIANLQKHGYDIKYDELLDAAGGGTVGRPHIASVLIRKGYFEQPQEIFDALLKRGRCCYVPRDLPDARDAVPLIHACGGAAVWAHPLSGQSGGRSYAKKMLRALLGFGLDAVEAYYTMFSPHETQTMLELAEENHLLCSGGSDFHGGNQPGVQLGSGGGSLLVPAELLEPLRERAERYQTSV